jgi:hypothetical protein
LAVAEPGTPTLAGYFRSRVVTARAEVERLFWDRVLGISEFIDSGNIAIEELRKNLLGLDEGFADRFDPANAYPEYVTVRLCRAIRNSLEPLCGESDFRD